MNHLRGLWKPILAGLVIALVAFGITVVLPGGNGLDFDIDSSPRAQAARNRGPYDLTELRVLNNVVIHVKDHYVEPDRVVPKRMLLAGLNAIQRSVAPVLVNYDEPRDLLTVQIDNQSREFHLNDVVAPWHLTPRLRQIFAFLQENLRDEDIDLRDIEYTAINGMLRTLDPHTVLLTPDVYEDMRTQTRGEFGGLGIVISIRDGQLTIIRPMPNTPAGNAGLRRNDRIVKINDESTLNMPLTEAVDRLRGAPGSQVSVWVVREGQGGWAQPRRFELTRAVIHIESIESRMLTGGVGYIKIKSFQGNTHEDMMRALETLHRQAQSSGQTAQAPNGMRGLVLDLRDDPGGLLEQAVRVADTFLTSGTIVTTSSNDPAQRDEKFATADGTEPTYPMIVLVNGGSASASEIVAGALKNQDRALIVGERTFGKGSVQVLYDYNDGSALKLTIAQYLTPGDVSIQGVGIVPDIAIDPMTVDREDMDLTVDKGYLRESDLRSHLTHENARDAPASSLVLRYYLPADKRQRLRESNPEDLEENERESEFLASFSRDLILQAQRQGRREMLRDAVAVLERAQAAEMSRAVAEMQRLGVDWSVGADAGASDVEVQVSTNAANNEARAGDPFELRIRVTNRGAAPLYQLSAITKSDYRLFDGRELVFGKLDPGQSRDWSTTLGWCETQNNRRSCALPKDIIDRADGIKIEFKEAHGHAPPPAELRTTIRALPRPQFAFQLQTADNVRGDGDGVLEVGEFGTMYLRVRNIGTGRSYKTEADLRNLTGRGVLLRDGRFRLDNLQPNEERVVAFTFEVLPDFDAPQAKFELSVVDTELREAVSEKLSVPIVRQGAQTSQAQVLPRTGNVSLREGAIARDAPGPTAGVVGTVHGGVLSLPVRAELQGGSFVRVDIGNGRPAWVASADIVTSAAASGARLEATLDHMAPRLEVDAGNTLVSRDGTLRIRGRATDDRLLRDMYIFVGAQKTFYRSNQGATDARTLEFDTQVPLRGGINYITVFVRENADVMTRTTVVVRRDAADGALLPTPPFDEEEFLDGSEASGDE